MNLVLENVNLIVTDVARARDFYVGVLGLQPDERRSAPPDFLFLRRPRWADVARAAAAGETAGAGPGMEIGFEADDLDAVAARLAAVGCGGATVETMGWGRALSVRDPDGHRLNLFTPKQRCVHERRTKRCSRPATRLTVSRHCGFSRVSRRLSGVVRAW